jgi:glycerol-3-phosphate dehydrogenase
MTIHDPRYSDVIIIGGGATGAGIARDCALRGLSVTLLERHDIATGATGRNHGLLHSGARYAVTDANPRANVLLKTRSSSVSPATALSRPTASLSPFPKMTSPFRTPLLPPARRGHSG